MAAKIGHQEIRYESSQSSRVSSMSASSSKSFCSWSNRTPRDSLEKMRQRNRMLKETTFLSNHQVLSSVRNFSSTGQDDDRSEEERVAESSSILLGTQVNLWPSPINRNMICDRYPKGKASLLVFVLNVIVSYAFGAAITGILDIFIVNSDKHLSPEEEHLFQFIQLLFQRCVSRIFYPLAGFFADVYIGRCRMIHTALLLLFIGYAILVVSYLLEGQSSFHTSDLEMVLKAMRVTAFLFISAGGGAFEATIIPFGVDQLQGASSAEISSYFHFFYFGRNLGITCGMVMYSLVSYIALKANASGSDLYSVLQPLVTMCILTVGLVLNVCLSHWYFKNTLWENPVKLVAKILCYAATVKRHLPVHRRAFRYGEEKKSRIDLAKVEYDGKFPAEKVEDVKAFCRICLLMFALIPTMVSVNAFYTIAGYEGNITLADQYPEGKFLMDNFYPNAFTILNSIFVLLNLPIVNFCVIPCFPKLTIKVRIGIGLVLYCLGMVTVIVIHAVNPGHQFYENVTKAQIWCLLLPIAIFSIAETLLIVSALEFIYAQSPESMKGFLTGVFYFVFGLSSFVSSLAFYEYSYRQGFKRLLPYHVGFTIFQVMGIVFYAIVAALHKNRLRPDGNSFNQQLLIQGQLN